MQNMTLIHGECLEVMDKLIDQKIKVSLVLTDEPYGTTKCKWDEVIPFHEMWPRIKNLKKDIHTPVILFGREPFTSKLITSNIKEYRHKWIWNKKQSGSPQNAKYMPLQLDEDIIVFSSGKVNYYPIMRKGKMRKRGGYKKSNGIMNDFKEGYENYSDLYYPTNIIEIYNPRISKAHPTQKPVQLMEYLIKTYSKEGDLILDFTMGSGTTGVACKNLNRQFIGIEKEKKYYDMAVERISTNYEGLKGSFLNYKDYGGMRKMERYIGTKLIEAEPMEKVDVINENGHTYPTSKAGYKVKYPDGYESWSPKDVFEESYRKINNLSFGMAFDMLKKGLFTGMRLPQWKSDVVIRIQCPDGNSKMTAPYLYVESRFGKVPWKETMIELFSEQWQLVE